MKGQMPAGVSRSLTETVGTSDIDQLLHDYVKPMFLRLSADNRQKALAVIKQMVSDQDEDD